MHKLTELIMPGLALQLDAGHCLHALDSGLQHIEVWQTPALGRVFTLDGSFMTAEADEFIYHESLVQPAMLAHASPRRAVVVGGGDGGSVRELLRHPGIERVDLFELDSAVVDMARRFLPRVHAGALDDERVHIRYGDGFAGLRQHRPACDVMVLDLSDPSGHAAALHTADFYRCCAECLGAAGVLSLHIGHPLFQPDRCRAVLAALHEVFAIVRPVLLPIPLYGGLWLTACASQTLDIAALAPTSAAERMQQRGLAGLRFYSPALLAGLMAMPAFVQDLLPKREG